ncbi:hypothetical protein DAY59_14645 [Salmonella enterica subsp. enterica serovar Enteritidis]|nr:hypothetical protein [Salmonella enterica subsp. enterica serovar Enteritidis]
MKNFFKIITDFIADISLDLFAIFLCMLFVYKTGPIQRNKTEQLKKN